MNLDELNFDLPPELIAQRPLAKRDDSRMMLLDRISGKWEDRQFREFPELLRGDELVVFNNARVIPARLFGKRIGIRATESGAHNPAKQEHLQADIEVLLVRQLDENRWETLVRPGRKVPVGERIIFGDGELEGVVQGREEFGLRVIRFVSKSGFHEALVRLGHIPLPPYIKREDEPADRDRYQTVYAKQGSAVAAPTAGLHFTPEMLTRLRERKIETAEITLDVGLGTFEPVRTEKLEDHKIHAESYEISEAAAAAIGVETVVGVANANSTPGFVKRLGFELLAPLPASVMVPTPGTAAGIRSQEAPDGAAGRSQHTHLRQEQRHVHGVIAALRGAIDDVG